MTGRLQLIEQKLIAIDSAGFQNLCDSYLVLHEQEFTSFNRTGSQLGKQKTIKGTPDTFYRLSNGALGYVEYTTKSENKSKKIIEDIDKCLDESVTGVPASEVNKITICFNSRLNLAEETKIIKYAQSKNIRIELIGIDLLAIEICSKHLLLAKSILGIPLDTGQVLPLQNFVEEYNNKARKLSTPIDNLFLHRVSELEKIENELKSKSLLIIAGFPGVGKTKLGIETIKRFLKSNPGYQAYAISKKDVDIHDDLRILLQQDKNYIILVDDANRQLPNLAQILGVFRESRIGEIKLIITVRSYAFEDITRMCDEHDFDSIEIKKFEDAEIKEIISSDSFKILNHKYQKKIIEISDGNARLAVMAARLAQEKQQEFLLGDVSDLYDSYFHTFIKDFDIFQNKTLLKTLGLISFFFSIDRNNKEFITKLLSVFELDYYEFNTAIDELHRRELIEVQYDYARVSEQILATYFFYKVFVKDEELSYRTLLDNYFPQWIARFRDTIIPSNNSFGYDSVLGKIDTILNEYFILISSNEEAVLAFLSLFWFYKPNETLTYFYNQIKKLPEPDSPVYNTSYESNDLVWERDRTLEFLSNFFHYNNESLKPALELAFEYCRKNPTALPDLIKRIREMLLFDEEDESTQFARQFKLFELLYEKFNKRESHYVQSFFALGKTFLSHHYHITKGGRKRSIVFYDYPLLYNPVTREFRKALWGFLFDNFDQYPDEVLDVIKKFRRDHRDPIKKMLAYDLTLLLPFIGQKLNATNFNHILYVHTLVDWLNKEDLENRDYQKMKAAFNSKEYEYFCKLDWDRLRDKESFDFNNYEEYQKLKGNDLRNSFVIDSEENFEILHKAIANVLRSKDNHYSLSQSLDIIVEENFTKNNELGFSLLSSLLSKYPPNVNLLYKSIKVISNATKEWSLKLLRLIRAWSDESKTSWLLTYFECIPSIYVDEALTNDLLEVIDAIETPCYIPFEGFDKFTVTDDQIHSKILDKLVAKIEQGNLRIKLSFNFFEKYTHKLSGNFDLLAKAYIQQEKMDNHFDLSREGLKQIISINPTFLVVFIKAIYSDENDLRRDTHNHLGFVWDLNLSEQIIENAINAILIDNPYLGISDYPTNIFFNNLTETQKIKARDFIRGFILKHAHDSLKINAIFDAIRHSLRDFFEEGIHHYLSKNIELESFKKIWWRGNGGSVHHGDVIFGELEASEWKSILVIIDKFPNQLDVIPIKGYIKERITSAMKYADHERKMRFVKPDWPF
jgi:DNA polymerase III delta prime subunit